MPMRPRLETIRPLVGPALRLPFWGVMGALAVSGWGAGCHRPPPNDTSARVEVKDAMARYQDAARRVDPAAIAAFYAADGVLLEPGIFPIQGPDSIGAFIRSFPGVKVDVATAAIDTIEIFGGSAFLWGSYFERLTFPGQPTSAQHGKFVVEWIRQPTGVWLIRRFYRIPLPGPPASAGQR